jgi:hypothetical protein
MKTQAEFIQRICAALGNAGIPYMIGGSVASSIHAPLDLEWSKIGESPSN